MRFTYYKIIIWLFLLASLLGSCKTSYTPHIKQVQNITLNQAFPADTHFVNFIAPYKIQLDSAMNQMIGYAAKDITRTDPPEILLTNFMTDLIYQFVADLILEEINQQTGKLYDLAAITKGGVRTSIEKGPIYVGDIFELMPFENEIYILTLDYATTLQLFDHLATKKNIAIANSKVWIKNNQIEKILIDQKPIAANKTYTLLISDYLANGGDDLFFLKKALKVENTGIKQRDLIIQHIQRLSQQGKKVNPMWDNRIMLE